MTKRIFRSICIVAITVFLASLALIMGVLYSYFSQEQMKQLGAQAALAARGVENGGLSYLEGLEIGDYRLTWIDGEGNVLFDNKAGSTEMENHLEREEIREALENGVGESSRYSKTMMERRLYSALRLQDGSVLRVSDTQYTWWSLALAMSQPILVVAALAIGMSLFLAYRLSKHIVQPLNRLNLDRPLEGDVYEELSPLLERLDSQQRQLRKQEKELEQKRNEFESATKNLTEGLVLLNEHGSILSINDSASRLLGISRYCMGKDLLLFWPEMRELLQHAQTGQHSEQMIPLHDGSYQINASPVLSGELVAGIALLIFDITEKEKAEQMRREFTSNVSHELKTPLQSISGCAELLASGMVREEDIPRFSEQILRESKWMISLVEDIIRLSHLDEGAEDMKREDCDLYELAETVVEKLQSVAEASNVELVLKGKTAQLNGIRQLLGGIVFNLCDNAIKYNRSGGRVTVQVEPRDGKVVLTVRDTGIGIPKEQQEHIFERFYRVDKSRSKAVGGTGLGLSIVKHAARLHKAEIQLESEPGKGTCITVAFPQEN